VFIDPPNGVSGRKGIQVGPTGNTDRNPSYHWVAGNTRISNNVINGGAPLLVSGLRELVREYDSNVESQSPDLGLKDCMNHDCRLTANATELRDRGTPANSPAHDFGGNRRDKRPDIGAYEFTSPDPAGGNRARP
jgi:hypothetical protein